MTTSTEIPTRLKIGVITSPHGVRGTVKVRSFTEDPDAFVDYGDVTTHDGERVFDISIVGDAKGSLLCVIDGVTDRDGAEALRGVELYIRRDALPDDLDDDEFYASDLLGLETRDAEGRVSGSIRSILDHGAGDIVDVLHTDGKVRSYEFSLANFPEINMGEGYVVLNPPPEVTAQDEQGNVH
ncbi:MAG: 16S rRNA processing protein RimM [Alphaproteobacteria bacterium TMED89]|nr:16S rRNA processing protein RimM [Rhodospirillaceae bacterium]RPH12614.1 MAG: 16S rRNA processing protein RimM [Alphaproteobacteria bacterium TMED89]